MAEEIKARGIVDGTAAGPALIGDEAISFLGDVDINTGQSHIVGGGPVPNATVDEVARDAFIKFVVHNGIEVQRVVHHGRKKLPADAALPGPDDALDERAEVLGDRRQRRMMRPVRDRCGREAVRRLDLADGLARPGGAGRGRPVQHEHDSGGEQGQSGDG